MAGPPNRGMVCYRGAGLAMTADRPFRAALINELAHNIVEAQDAVELLRELQRRLRLEGGELDLNDAEILRVEETRLGRLTLLAEGRRPRRRH